MRTAIVVLVALGSLLGLAAPAHAKGPTAAVIEGPGLSGPVRVDSYYPTDRLPSLDRLMQWTGGTVMFDLTTRFAPDGPTGDRGPRYTVTYYLDRQPVLNQELYPFAIGGPYSYTRPGQRSVLIEAELPSGWLRVSEELRTWFVQLGVEGPPPGPATAVPTAPAAQPVSAATVEQSSEQGPVPLRWWLTGGLAAAAGLGVGGVLLRRRPSPPAPVAHAPPDGRGAPGP